MNPLQGLAYGFGVASTPDNFIAALVGSLLGTAIGILPGMSPTVAMALLLIPTMGMKAETSLIMLGAIYFGTQYGASMTAILMGVPSEMSSVVIGMDGHQIALKGRAGAALAVCATASFIGASIGLIGLATLAGPVSQAALVFGPPEYFALTVVGLLVLSRLANSSPPKALMALTIGLALTTVGVNSMTGDPRFTFGIVSLMQGTDLVAVVIGIVGMAEMFQIAAKSVGLAPAARFSYREIFPSRSEWKDAVPASLRGSILGFLFGLLPGPTMALSTFASYRLEQRLAPDRVGKGAMRAVSGPKSADDSAISGHLVPLLALGVPFSAAAAILYAGLLLHGVTPGPGLIDEQPDIFWGLVAAMYIGNVALLILNFPLVGMWMSIVRIPQPILSAILVVLMLIGAYSIRNSMVDMLTVVIMGILGYVMKQLGYERTLVILGMVLGPMLENNFGRSLQMSGGDLTIFISGPIDLALYSVLLVFLIAPPIWRLIGKRRTAGAEAVDLP